MVVGVVDGWIVADGVSRLAAGGRWDGRHRTWRPDPADRASSAIPGAHNVSNALAAVAAGLLFGVAPDAIRDGRGGVHGRRAPARAGRRWSTASAS